MTEAELISKLKELKQIKPNRAWADLAKKNILNSPVAAVSSKPAKAVDTRWTFSDIVSLFVQRKYAYAFAVFAFIFVGVLGIAQHTLPGDVLFPVKQIAEQSQASLLGQNDVASNVEVLKNRSEDLAQAIKENKQSNIPSAINEVKNATSDLANAIAKDPAMAKEVALQIKDNATILDTIGGTDLKQTSDVLYKTIDDQMIAALQKTTLTDSQKQALGDIDSLYSQGKYSDALEKILLIK